MVDSGIRLSVNTSLGPEALALRSLSGEERISRPFRFGLEMDSPDGELDFEAVVGRSATVTIEHAGGSRHVDGVIGRLLQEGRTAEGRTVYRAELRPRLWLLGMSSDCRVFQEMSAPEIVEAVLAENGVTDYELRLEGSYRPRSYSVQYNESALSFVSRLLEEEGIFYFFEHREGGHTLVLGDFAGAFTAAAEQPLLYGQALSSCGLEEAVVSTAVGLDDFNFETPSSDLQVGVESDVARGSGRRLFEYPGGYARRERGEQLAGIRMQERESARLALRGESGSAVLASGGRFTLEGHYRYDVNGDYVAERVSLEVSGDSLRCGFCALPATVTYRPPRVTPRPRIAGPQTALVVGPSGEEVWTDRYGRVKVQFHWDRSGSRDENSSCWVRVSHSWAGKGWGQLYLPRIGQEVVVDFEEGDPDRPLIIGRLYNAEQTVPVELPEERTRSLIRGSSSPGGGGGNELAFEDAAGSEEVYLRAQRQLLLEVGGDEAVEVGGGLSLSVGRDRAESVGRDQTATVGNNQTTSVGADQTTTVGGARTVEVAGSDRLAVAGELAVEAGRGRLHGARHLVLEAGASIAIRVGKTKLTLSKDAVELSAPKIKLSASRTLEVGSRGGMALSAASAMKLRGDGSLRIASAGTLTVKGALVKIN